MQTAVEQYKENGPATAGPSRAEKMRKDFEELDRLDDTIVISNMRKMIAQDDMGATEEDS